MLSVTASMIETWGPWRPTFMSSDLFLGLPRLVNAYAQTAHGPTRFASRIWSAVTKRAGAS